MWNVCLLVGFFVGERAQIFTHLEDPGLEHSWISIAIFHAQA